MAYAQVKFEIFGHIKTRKTSKALGIKPVHLVGHLAALWAWAIESAPDGDLSDCEPDDIAAAALWEGNPNRFCDQLAANSWLIPSERNPDRLAINDWFDHTGNWLLNRAKAKKRKDKWKEKNVPGTFLERSENAFPDRSENVLERPILDQIRLDQIKEEERKKEDIPPSAAQSTSELAPRVPRVPRVKTAQVVTGGSEIWRAYAEAFGQRYGKEPSVRGAKQNSVCAQIAQQAGVERGAAAVRHYVQHNEPFYLRNRHAIEHCLKDLHTLAEQAESNIFITSNDARSTTVATTIAEVMRQRGKREDDGSGRSGT